MTLATFAAVMPGIAADWGLTASEAGWIGGIYFAGYAASVPRARSVSLIASAAWATKIR